MPMQNTSQKQRNPIDRILATVVNGAEVARYGGLRTEEDPAPFELVAHQPVYRLRHYFADATPGRPPVVLVPPLGQVADVWDISPATSAVRMLHEQGLDPWVVDFGDPHDQPGGRERTFTDHVLAVVDTVPPRAACDRTRRASRRLLPGRHLQLRRGRLPRLFGRRQPVGPG